MRYKLKEVSREPVSESKCRHCWKVESANGPTSRGVCKFCGAEKEFYNSLPDFTIVRRDTHVFEFPDSPDIEPDIKRDDSELEEVNASL